jgi:hypothetical protein
MYVVFDFISEGIDRPIQRPVHILVAGDQRAFIGIVTNVMLGLLATLVLRRRRPPVVGRPADLLGREPRAGRVRDRACSRLSPRSSGSGRR